MVSEAQPWSLKIFKYINKWAYIISGDDKFIIIIVIIIYIFIYLNNYIGFSQLDSDS